jgi:hypothetical protein
VLLAAWCPSDSIKSQNKPQEAQPVLQNHLKMKMPTYTESPQPPEPNAVGNSLEPYDENTISNDSQSQNLRPGHSPNDTTQGVDLSQAEMAESENESVKTTETVVTETQPIGGNITQPHLSPPPIHNLHHSNIHNPPIQPKELPPPPHNIPEHSTDNHCPCTGAIH